jgi:hypothetical protein
MPKKAKVHKMTTDLLPLKRYVLRQDFYDAVGAVESCETAILTVIGDHQEAELAQRLQYWTYDSERFDHISRGDAGGRWITTDATKIAGYGVGLIWVTTQTPTALTALEAELLCYHAANTKPILIVQPPDEAFADQIKSVLAGCGVKAPFISLEAGSAKNVAAVMSIVEATLMPFTYPGIVCLDLADIHTIFDPICSAYIKIIKAPSGTALVQHLSATLRFASAPSSIYVAFYFPGGKVLELISLCMSEIRAKAPENCVSILTILTDNSLAKAASCNNYAAYITART